MIRENALFCKLIRIKNPSKILFDSHMTSFRPERQTCPSCSSSGNCHIHAYYGRRLIDFIHGVPAVSEVTILRLICDSCGHTHAVLPDLIIPYRSYSLFFILRVLAEAFLCRSSRESLCERFQISMNQLLQWLRLWNAHKQEWLGLLMDSEVPNLAFLIQLSIRSEYSSFSRDFTTRTALSFLQAHRNPG